MPDLTSASTLAIAALGSVGGSALTLLVQFIGSRFTESHKASLAATAKQKEQYYEKQAAAITTCFEKLQKWEDAHAEVTQRMLMRERPDFDKKMEAYIAESLKELTVCHCQFTEFFDSHLLYLPKHLIPKIIALREFLQDTGIGCSSLLRGEPFSPEWDKREPEDMLDRRLKAMKLLEELGDEFRKRLHG